MTVVSSYALNASWGVPEANGSPVKYYVLACTKGTEEILRVNVTGGAQSFLITNLTWSTEYTLKVMATNDVGTSAEYNSNAIAAKTFGLVPLAPVPLTVSDITSDTARL